MTQEDKELLLKDLCARLPYGVKVDIIKNCQWGIYTLYPSDIDSFKHNFQDVTPYLRSMESMTEEEKEELKTLFDAEEITSDSICYLEGGTLEEYLSRISFSFCSEIIDWLNQHHFDYRGLIEKGLAIEVNKSNNPYEY